MLNKKLLVAAAAACVAGASHAADTLNFSGTADDTFQACLSASLDWAGCGPTFATGADWKTMFNASTGVTGAGYLLVKAENEGVVVDNIFVPNGPAMFVANLSLTGGGFEFCQRVFDPHHGQHRLLDGVLVVDIRRRRGTDECRVRLCGRHAGQLGVRRG